VENGEYDVESDLIVANAQQTAWNRHFDRPTFSSERPERRVGKEPIPTTVDPHGNHPVASVDERIMDGHG
jgi:hypothetical protein